MDSPDSLWTIIGSVLGIFTAFSAVVLLALRFMLQQTSNHIDGQFKSIDARFTQLESMHEAEAREVQRIDKELLRLRAELPDTYVRREDWIRFSNVIDAKQDRINERLNDLLEQLRNGHGK